MGCCKIQVRILNMALATFVIGVLLTFPSISAATIRISSIDWIGEDTFATGLDYSGTEVGGLSGIDYDPLSGRYYAISDDRNNARFYSLEIDLSDGTLDDGDTSFTGVTTMRDTSGSPFTPNSVDPEAIRFDSTSSTLYWSSEGDANASPALETFVREMNLDGTFVRELTNDNVPPDKYAPTADASSGIRDSLAFESIALSPDGGRVITATENALYQDGTVASLADSSPSRILSYDKATGIPASEYIYEVDPIPGAEVKFIPQGEGTRIDVSGTKEIRLNVVYVE